MPLGRSLILENVNAMKSLKKKNEVILMYNILFSFIVFVSVHLTIPSIKTCTTSPLKYSHGCKILFFVLRKF